MITRINPNSSEFFNSLCRRQFYLKGFWIFLFCIIFYSSGTAEYREFQDRFSGIEFLRIKGGCYEMGDVIGDGNADERPVHGVCLKDFYLGKYEVTQEQWEKVTGTNPSVFQRSKSYPVENISWYEVQEFISKLNRISGESYRLPTEAEWEYAARSGGRKEKWAGTSIETEVNDFAWTDINSGGESHPVGQKNPNGIGLFDMTGNVWEWVADWYDQDYYQNSPSDNPQGPDYSWDKAKVIRGGSWISMPGDSRNSLRAKAIPHVRGNIGFRLAFSSP